ncbi:MAG: hypothetical protein HY341_01450 [Candidatus Kerfeldbacteria bacterium]|nr:hypothetical protein [Candidatus Kerfeldbacteria bacterium]
MEPKRVHVPGLVAAAFGIGAAIVLVWIGIRVMMPDGSHVQTNALVTNTARNTNRTGNANVPINGNRPANTNAVPNPDDPQIFTNGSVSTSCTAIDDCILADRTLDLRSCWPGACKITDNASDDVASVNAASYESYRTREESYRPTDCGPAPGCPVGIGHPEVQAECVASRCAKVVREIEELPPDMTNEESYSSAEKLPSRAYL